MKRTIALLSGTIFLATAANATTYTSDTNGADFFLSNYATFTNFVNSDGVSSPYTPTNTQINNGIRVYQGNLSGTGLNPNNNWILASFSSPTASIRVFPNIDHLGSAYDGYQYTIFGTNNLAGPWTALFDATSVVGATEPFTLGTFTGTAPSTVNNVISQSGSGGSGLTGYIADFTFGSAYQYYAFGASTVAFAQSNPDQEFSAVGALQPGVPEPSTWAMMI